jgi:hypothetical protein
MRVTEHNLKIVWKMFGITFRMVVGLLHQITTTQTKKTNNMKHTNIKIALLTTICFLLSLVLINIGEDMGNKGIVFMGLLSLSASAFILAFLLGERVVSTFKK